MSLTPHPDGSARFAHYTTALEFDASNNPIFLGMAVQGSGGKGDPVWQIRRVTFDGSNNPTDIKYANGSTEFNSVWNDRATLAYS